MGKFANKVLIISMVDGEIILLIFKFLIMIMEKKAVIKD